MSLARLRRAGRVLVAFVWVGLIPACDSNNGGTGVFEAGPSGDVGTFDEFVRRAAARFCARAVVPCCVDENVGQAACEADVAAGLRQNLRPGDDAVYSPQGGGKCLAAIETLSCASDDDSAVDQTCPEVLRGSAYRTKQPGDACSRDNDCVAPVGGAATCELACAPGGTACSDRCQARTAAKRGEPCQGFPSGEPTFTGCGNEDVCSGGTCVARPPPSARHDCH